MTHSFYIGTYSWVQTIYNWNLSKLICFAGNLQLELGRQQKNPVTLYNKNLQGAFVTWQEGDVVVGYQIIAATRPLCSPLCTSQQTCAVPDKCVSKTGGGFYVRPYFTSSLVPWRQVGA